MNKRGDNQNNRGTSKELISKDFFPESIEIDESRVFPMIVMATMSSGKSTLINALLGKQLLPSSNMACTAKMYSILDDDRDTSLKAFVTNVDGKTTIKDKNIEEVLQNVNIDDNISQVFIRGHVKGVLNTDKALLIVDTPGPNNSQNEHHEKKMCEILNKIKGGLILYVLNATQIGIKDDKYLLGLLSKHVKNHKKVKVVFAVNKIDQIDYEKESVGCLMQEVKEYLENNGFYNANIIPVSGLAANVFKKVLSGEDLTRIEYRSFEDCYEIYKSRDYNMKSFSIIDDYPDQYKEIVLRNKVYSVAELLRALENTGINLLEEFIQREQILSSGKIKNTIRIR